MWSSDRLTSWLEKFCLKKQVNTPVSIYSRLFITPQTDNFLKGVRTSMDSTEKLRVLLKHWIDHNGGHVAEFDKWRQTMVDENRESLAVALVKAMAQMDEVSATLQAALDELGGAPGSSSGHHHHHHHH